MVVKLATHTSKPFAPMELARAANEFVETDFEKHLTSATMFLYIQIGIAKCNNMYAILVSQHFTWKGTRKNETYFR